MPPCSDWPFYAPPLYLSFSLCLFSWFCLWGFIQTIISYTLFPPPILKETWGTDGIEGWRKNKKRSQIKADISTPKADINQLPGNTEKDREKETGRKGVGGIKAWLTFSEKHGQERCVCTVFCTCMWESVCVAPLELIIQQSDGHEGIIAGAHTHWSLSQHLFLFIYGSVSTLRWLAQTLCSCSCRDSCLSHPKLSALNMTNGAWLITQLKQLLLKQRCQDILQNTAA